MVDINQIGSIWCTTSLYEKHNSLNIINFIIGILFAYIKSSAYLQNRPLPVRLIRCYGIFFAIKMPPMIFIAEKAIIKKL
jgi:hypothetical protein